MFLFLEKAFKKKTVLKPPQVDGYNILRRWENDTEGTRQIDSVTFGEGVLYLRIFLFSIKCHIIGGSDCLSKTQDSAKL